MKFEQEKQTMGSVVEEEEAPEILEKKNETYYIIGEIIETDLDNSKKIIFHRD
mgnify:CR=1 FL=1